MLTELALFVGSLAGLVLAARVFTTAADKVGLAFGMSPFSVGVLLVAAGTSMPELSTSLLAAGGETSDIVIGNVLGANIANMMMALGLVSLASRGPIFLGERYLFIDLHFLIGSAALLGLAITDGAVSRVEAGFLLAGYAIYIRFLLTDGSTSVSTRVEAEHGAAPLRRHVPWGPLALLLGSGAGIYFAANVTVDMLERLALGFGVPAGVVAVTLLSIGTTLPESVTSIVAARSGQAEVAVGNIMGSCVFNAFAVTGVAAMKGPITAPPALLGLPFGTFVVGTILFYLVMHDKRISRWEGVLFLLLFGLFVAKMAGVA